MQTAIKSRILVIEDEEGVRKFIKRALEPAYEVHLARDGQEGLRQVRWVKPGLILLDLRMPGLDGLTVLAKLKAHAETRMIPVVIVSVQGESETLMEAQRGGAVDQLIKPFSVEDLRGVVERQILLGSRAPDPTQASRPEPSP
jgi:DNA-binding response OmpR family regulator